MNVLLPPIRTEFIFHTRIGAVEPPGSPRLYMAWNGNLFLVTTDRVSYLIDPVTLEVLPCGSVPLCTGPRESLLLGVMRSMSSLRNLFGSFLPSRTIGPRRQGAKVGISPKVVPTTNTHES